MTYHHMQKEYLRLEAEAEKIRRKLQALPEGKLICCNHKGKYQKWYQSVESKKIYIPKKNRALAEQLALKNFFLAQLEDLENEKRAIAFYLRHYPKSRRTEMILSEASYAELLAPNLAPLSQILSDWMHEPYTHNQYRPEQLIYKCIGGITVRSKSESMIVTALMAHQIPFRYECALQLGEKVIFPDFTVCHPQTGEVYYWEHFGLMDNANYAKNACAKIQLYVSYNMIPTMQLITTYETKEQPLTSEMIEKVIAHYFL